MIQVYLRQCYYSDLEKKPDRSRPSWWDKKKAFENFKNTLDSSLVNYTIVYDEHYGDIQDTFLKDEKNVVKINCGNEGLSFISALQLAIKSNEDDQIVYFLEDDYLHLPGWTDVLLDAFSRPFDYVTLYDHPQHYMINVSSYVIPTKLSHWRQIPYTTNTFAAKIKTLKEDLDIHQKHSIGYEFTWDEGKFLDLKEKGRTLVSSIPGYSTHCHSDFLCPLVNWEKHI